MYLVKNNIDLNTKILLTNFYKILQLKTIMISIFIKKIRKLKDIVTLKALCSLDIITLQKPFIKNFKIIFNYKKHSFNYLTKVTLTTNKKFHYLKLFQYYIYSEMLNNHLFYKVYNSFNLKNLTLIPFIDESYFKTTFKIKTQFIFNKSYLNIKYLNKQQRLILLLSIN